MCIISLLGPSLDGVGCLEVVWSGGFGMLGRGEKPCKCLVGWNTRSWCGLGVLGCLELLWSGWFWMLNN